MTPQPGEMPIDEWREMMDRKSEDALLQRQREANGRKMARLTVLEKTASLDARIDRLHQGKFDSPEARRQWLAQHKAETENRETQRLHAELRQQIQRLADEQARLSAPRRQRELRLQIIIGICLLGYIALAIFVPSAVR